MYLCEQTISSSKSSFPFENLHFSPIGNNPSTPCPIFFPEKNPKSSPNIALCQNLIKNLLKENSNLTVSFINVMSFNNDVFFSHFSETFN